VTNLILRLLDGFRWLFRLMKVDYPKFRALLWVKLTVDNREEKSVAQRRSDREVSNSMIWVMVIYAFLGIFAGALLLHIQSLFVSLVLIYAMIMLMTAVALISDFSSILLDTTDNAILQFRPIDGRTMAVTRIVHIILYMLMITLSLSLGTLVIGTVKHGPLFTLLFLVSLIFAVLDQGFRGKKVSGRHPLFPDLDGCLRHGQLPASAQADRLFSPEKIHIRGRVVDVPHPSCLDGGSGRCRSERSHIERGSHPDSSWNFFAGRLHGHRHPLSCSGLQQSPVDDRESWPDPRDKN
jgi:hypothetical protein